MKKFKVFFAFAVMALFSLSVLAQQETFLLNDTSENGLVKFRRYNASLHLHPASTEKELLNSTLKIGPGDELRLFSTRNDELGYTHNFYQQFYQGIKVESATYATHTLNGDIVSINGEFSKVGNPVIKPNLTEAQALSNALQYIKAVKYRWQIPAEETSLKSRKKDSSATYYPSGEMVICYDYMKTQSYRLAYKFYISGYFPVSSNYVYVDALNGSIVAAQNLLRDVNVVTTVATKYSGNQTITTDQFNNGGTQEFRLQEVRGASNVSIQSFNSQRVNSTAHVDFLDLTNTWTASNNPNMDNAALDAHWASEKIYDYWSTVRGVNSYDGLGAAMISFVHYNLPWTILNGIPQYHSGTDNSSWDGGLHIVELGDGYTQFNPLTSFDVCAHEFGHGFTEGAQPALLGAGGILSDPTQMHPEALALNEGISDIWGAVVENWGTTGKQTWEIAEEVMKDGKPCLRSLQNPTTGGDPTGTAHNGYPSTYHDSYWDYGNASHTNSTVMSHWFSLALRYQYL